MKPGGPPERRVGLGRGPGPARRKGLNPGKGLQPGKELERKGSLSRGQPIARSSPPRPEPGAPAPRRPRSASTEVPERVRKLIYRRDDDTCARCGRELFTGMRQLQHRAPRGSGGRGRKVDAHRLSALVTLCGRSATDPDGCHHHVESYRDQARRDGYLVPMDANPEQVPILWHDGEWYLLGDDGTRTHVTE